MAIEFSEKGYLKNSPDVNKPLNIIPGNKITMKGVDFKVLMYPGYDYTFPGAQYVIEKPIDNG